MLSKPLLMSFSIYLIVVALVGYVAYRITSNLSDFVLGGRRLNGPVAALSAGASDMSAWLLLGLPGTVYLYGLNQIWLPVGLTVGAYLNWRLTAPRLRVYTEKANDALTVPAFLDNRFEDKSGWIRVISALATLVFFSFYSASGLVGGALVLANTFPGLDYTQALLIGTAIIVLYTFVGGFLAVSWTDFFQGIFMFICLLMVPVLAVSQIGELGTTIDLMQSQRPGVLSWSTGIQGIAILNLLAWGIGYFGQPHILVRFMAVKNLKAIVSARRICMGWMTLSLIGAVLTGLVGIAYFYKAPLADPESVFILFSSKLFGPVMAGLILAAIMSSIMCALDSQMLAAASALTEDVYHVFIRPQAGQKELVYIGRLAVMLFSIVALLLAWEQSARILDLVGFAWAGLASTFAAPVFLSLYWSKMTREGAIAGLATGMVTAIVWHIWFAAWSGLYEIMPGVVLSALAVYIVSKATIPVQSQIEKTLEVKVLAAL